MLPDLLEARQFPWTIMIGNCYDFTIPLKCVSTGVFPLFPFKSISGSSRTQSLFVLGGGSTNAFLVYLLRMLRVEWAVGNRQRLVSS